MDRTTYPSRKTSLGEPEDHDYLASLTPGERMAMVWQLTLQAWAFEEDLRDEPRLRRDIGRAIRGGG